MFVRRFALLLPLVAALFLGAAVTSPAGAVVPMVVPDPVTGLSVGTQTQGANQSWNVPASWTGAAGADGYTVSITNTAGTTTYKTKDVAGSATSTTLTTPDLLAGQDYLVSVVPFSNADGPGTGATAPFTAITLDTTAPTGTFTVTPTHAFLASDFLGFDPASASVVIRQTALSDDSPGTITRQVVAGDGTAAKSWTSGSFTVTYTRAGTFTPKVLLTDVYGNSAAVDLAPVTIALDGAAPVVRITQPSAALRHRIAGWRVIRGTATDAGSGVDAVLVMVLEKRGGVWYAYDFHHRKWLKGYTREIKTLNKTKAMPAFMIPSSLGAWHTPKMRGLRTGRLAVRTAAFDKAGNVAVSGATRVKITSR